MPTVALTFNLPDEKSEFSVAIQGGKYLCLLTDIWETYRRKAKDNPDYPISHEALWDELRSLFDDQCVDVYSESVL